MAGGVGQQVAVLVVLTEPVGAGFICFFSVAALAVQTPVEISECDGFVLGNGFLDGIHIVVDGLVHALDPAGHQHIPPHQPGIVDTALVAQLLDQLSGFLFGEESAGLHRIDEQLQLGNLEVPGCDVVAAVFAGDGNNVHAVVLEGSNIGVYSFSVAGNVVAVCQHCNQLRSSHRVVLVGVSL